MKKDSHPTGVTKAGTLRSRNSPEPGSVGKKVEIEVRGRNRETRQCWGSSQEYLIREFMKATVERLVTFNVMSLECQAKNFRFFFFFSQ